MIFYAMLPNMEHPTFEAREMGVDVAQSILDNLNKGPVWGYLTEFDMGRIQGMVEAGALMNGAITIKSNPHQIGMLMLAYGNHALYGIFEKREHDPNFSFVMTREMHPKIIPLSRPAIEWEVTNGKGYTEIVRFDNLGQPVDLPCEYKEPRVQLDDPKTP